MLTGKCKEDFEKWFKRLDGQEEEHEWFIYLTKGRNPIGFFYEFPFSMQYGVYVDFFDSVGLTLLINTETYDCWWSTILEEDLMSPYFESCKPIETESRNEARTKAIKKANEIYNNYDTTRN